MKLLLDTHTFLWFIMGSPHFSANARALIEDIANEKFFSVASLWEMAIKLSIGKLALTAPLDVLIPQQLSLNGIESLTINTDHAAAVVTLPFHQSARFFYTPPNKVSEIVESSDSCKCLREVLMSAYDTRLV